MPTTVVIGLPEGCNNTDKENKTGHLCAYYLAMGPNEDDKDFLNIHLEASMKAWVAVGFSKDKLMVSMKVAPENLHPNNPSIWTPNVISLILCNSIVK